MNNIKVRRELDERRRKGGKERRKLIQLDPIGESAPDFSRITYVTFFLKKIKLKEGKGRFRVKKKLQIYSRPQIMLRKRSDIISAAVHTNSGRYICTYI